jgi:hypothetical protein
MEKKFVTTKNITYSGVKFGSALAMVISFTTNKSIIWAIIHAVFGWIYVVYYALGFGR